MNKNNHSFSVYFHIETAKAIGVKEDPDNPEIIWLPKSQIEWDRFDHDAGDVIDVVAPEWLARAKGLM